MKTTPSLLIARRGFMFVLSSPSGVGKTTVAHKILSLETSIELSVSVTTRPKRPTEIEGKDYYFLNQDAFDHMVQEDKLLEHADVYGYQYGTPKASIERELAMGTDILFDIDWQGTQQLKQVGTGDLVSIFLLPPTFKDLEERLYKRGADQEETIRMRMRKASDELSHWAEYDYVIVNSQLEETVHSVQSILQAERLKRRRQPGLANFVNELRRENN
jgi:guanylate kinase